MRAVILAGGLGKRLAPYTNVLPKPLMPIQEMPIIEIVIRQLKFYGIKRITLCVGYLGSLLEAYLGDGSSLDVNIDYSYEKEPLGTAAPIKLLRDLDEPFLMMNGDLLTNLNFGKLLNFHLNHDEVISISIFEKTLKTGLGVISFDESGFIQKYEEKPSFDFSVSMGIYAMNPEVLSFIPEEAFFDLPDLINLLLKKKIKIKIYKENCTWLDVGIISDYEEACNLFQEDKSFFLPEK